MDLDALTARLTEAGFDIVVPFPARDIVAIDPAFASLGAGTLGVLVGNTRALWPHVIAARQRDPATFVEHPFDRYTELGVSGAIHDPPRTTVIYAHAQDSAGHFFPFQRLAVAVGLAALAPSQLLIHPTFGPWFALRAVIVGPGTPPPVAPRVPLPCDCAKHGCVATFDHAMARPDDWRAWVAVRDACPVGRAYRYEDDQVAYHYTKERRFLPVIG